MHNEINKLYEEIQGGKRIDTLTTEELRFVFETIEGLDAGRIRVCEKQADGKWITNEWIKKAILMYFRIQKMEVMDFGDITYYDKIPLKKWSEENGVRVVPHALARKGSFIEKGAILMPSYTNIGAYVGAGTMVDTWATVGSCAQIGKNVHLSGGVGIGGVLEPVQASPVIIEEGAVLGAGVTITASTKIIDVTGPTPVEYKGRVPANCVVIPGTQMKEFPSGNFGVPCALIIGKRKPSTDLKTSLTEALRDHQVSV